MSFPFPANHKLQCFPVALPSFCFSSGAGSHYGTFSGPVDYFSPKTADRKAFESSSRNFVTNPLKKGTGYGYVNVLIGKPETYSSEPYDRGRELFVVSCLF